MEKSKFYYVDSSNSSSSLYSALSVYSDIFLSSSVSSISFLKLGCLLQETPLHCPQTSEHKCSGGPKPFIRVEGKSCLVPLG